MTRLRSHILSCLTAVGLMAMATVLGQSLAYGEAYIAGQFGLSMPSIGKGLTNVDLTGSFPAGSTLSDNALKSSVLGGLKAGFFFPKARWFGLETEAFYTTPHIKQQTLIFTIPSSPTVIGGQAKGEVQGAHLGVLTWAPMNLVIRYPKTRLQPYAAIGPGIFFARVSTADGSQRSTRLGLNTQLGLQYYITRRVTAFAEWKYNLVRLHFSETPALFGFNATYDMHNFVVGIGYHF